jgi:hypothetical protein
VGPHGREHIEQERHVVDQVREQPPPVTHTSAYVSIRQHTSAYVSIRQHTSAYCSIRQHTRDMREHVVGGREGGSSVSGPPTVATCVCRGLGGGLVSTMAEV